MKSSATKLNLISTCPILTISYTNPLQSVMAFTTSIRQDESPLAVFGNWRENKDVSSVSYTADSLKGCVMKFLFFPALQIPANDTLCRGYGISLLLRLPLSRPLTLSLSILCLCHSYFLVTSRFVPRVVSWPRSFCTQSYPVWLFHTQSYKVCFPC